MSGARIQFTIDDEATLCDINVPNESEAVVELRAKKANRLRRWFEQGGTYRANGEIESTARDEYRANGFENLNLELTQIKPKKKQLAALQKEAKAGEEKAITDLQQEITDLEKTKKETTSWTGSAYRKLSWYTYGRITLLGFYVIGRNALEFFNGAFSVGASTILHDVFGLAGLTFGVELLIDLSMVAKAVFFPQGSIQKQTPWYTRLWDALTKDSRPSRMLNALLWVTANALGFLLSGGFGVPVTSLLATGIMVGGFVLDIISGQTFTTLEINRLTNLRKKVKAKIKELKEDNSDPVQLAYLQARKSALKQEIEFMKKDRGKVGDITAVFFTAGVLLLGVTLLAMAPVITPIIAGVLTAAVIAAGALFAIGGVLLIHRRLSNSSRPAAEGKAPRDKKAPDSGSYFNNSNSRADARMQHASLMSQSAAAVAASQMWRDGVVGGDLAVVAAPANHSVVDNMSVGQGSRSPSPSAGSRRGSGFGLLDHAGSDSEDRDQERFELPHTQGMFSEAPHRM